MLLWLVRIKSHMKALAYFLSIHLVKMNFVVLAVQTQHVTLGVPKDAIKTIFRWKEYLLTVQEKPFLIAFVKFVVLHLSKDGTSNAYSSRTHFIDSEFDALFIQAFFNNSNRKLLFCVHSVKFSPMICHHVLEASQIVAKNFLFWGTLEHEGRSRSIESFIWIWIYPLKVLFPLF